MFKKIIEFFSTKFKKIVAENGDVKGKDNDGDGRKETKYVKPSTRKDGTKTRGHFRAEAKKRVIGKKSKKDSKAGGKI